MLKRAILIAIIVSLGLALIFAFTRRGKDSAAPTPTPAVAEVPAPTPTQPPSPTPTQQATPQATATVTPTPEPTPVPAPAVAIGQPLTYTLTITNHGPSDATGVTITDTLAAGVEFIAATSTYTPGVNCRAERGGITNTQAITIPGLILCDIGDMPRGTSVTIAVVVRPVTATGTMAHTATVAARENDPHAQGNVFDEQTTVKPAADLGLRAGGTIITAENMLIYTLTVVNAGPSPATGVIVTDALPLGATLDWSRPGKPACTLQDITLDCDLGQLDQGSATLTFDINPDLDAGISTETLPLGVTLDLEAPTCENDDGAITCHLGDLGQGKRANITLAARVAPFTGTFTNTAAVTANEIDPHLADNRVVAGVLVSAALPSLAATPVPTAADLRVRADVSRQITTGQPLTYALTVVNAGPADATNVRLETDHVMDNLPQGMSLVSLTPGSPSCTHSEDTITCFVHHPDTGDIITLDFVFVSDADSPMQTVIRDMFFSSWPACKLGPKGLSCSLGDLKRGQETQVTLVSTVGGLVTGTITRTATVTAAGLDLDPANNILPITTTVNAATDLAIRSQVSGPVIAGQAVTYTLTFTNYGPSFAQGTVVTGALSPGVEVLSVTPSQDTHCQVAGGEALSTTVVCELYLMNSGDVATVLVAVVADDLASETVTHRVVVTTTSTDPNSANNQALLTLPLSPVADLSITDQ
jgi:uncharacterized repeat protein (TIGR01451 family)